MTVRTSVIVTVYNDEQHLAPALESVLGQTMADLELICVDDGSTDRSSEILDAFAARDSRVVVLRQANAGAGVARRLGAERAAGAYIYFMDSDDLLEPFAFERAVEMAEREKLDLVRFETRSFADTPEQDSQAARENGWWPIKTEYATVLSGGELLAALVANREYQAMSWLHLMRRETLEGHGVTWPAQRWSEDQAYTVHCYLAAARAGVIALPLHRRRSRATSISHTSATAPYLQGRVQAYIDIARFSAHHASDESVANAVDTIAGRQLLYAAQALNELGPQQARDLLAATGESAEAAVVIPALEYLANQITKKAALQDRVSRLESRYGAFRSISLAKVWRRLTRRR